MSRSPWVRAGVSILLLLILVNGVAFSEEQALSGRLNSFIEHFMKDSEDSTLGIGSAKLYRLVAGSPLKAKELDSSDGVTDGYSHTCELILDSHKKTRVLSIVFTVSRMASVQQHEAYCFRLSSHGTVELAVKSRMLFSGGEPVQGSGHSEELDIKSPATHNKLQHEIDFWLMGKYRKAKVSDAAGSAGAIRKAGGQKL